MPSVSIIVPLYNKSRYLSGMIDSVLKQKFADFELIIIDDGSTDESGKIADGYAANDSRIKVRHIKNQGVSHARNTGLDMVSGTYITFLDADDTVGPDYLDTLYTCLKENSAEFVIGGLSKVWRDSGKTVEIKPPYEGKKNTAEILDDFAEIQKNTGIYGFCTSKMFSENILGDTRFDEHLILAEDFDFYLKLYRKINEICFCDNTDYYYLQETENSPLNVRDEDIDYFSQLGIQVRFAEFLKDMGVYSGVNREIVEKSISNYAYLTLHHSAKENFSQRFNETYELIKEKSLPLNGEGIRRKTVLTLLKQNQKAALLWLIQGYKGTGRLIRRLMKH